jgi:hypothetical protein
VNGRHIFANLLILGEVHQSDCSAALPIRSNDITKHDTPLCNQKFSYPCSLSNQANYDLGGRRYLHGRIDTTDSNRPSSEYNEDARMQRQKRQEAVSMNKTADLVEGLGNMNIDTMPENAAEALRLLKLAAAQGNAKGQVSSIALDVPFPCP